MPFFKYAKVEAEVLDVYSAPERRTASLDKLSTEFDSYRTSDGFIYARIRAISSRRNKNGDIWPSVELAGSQDIFDRHHSSEGGFIIEANREKFKYGFSTFMGKPVFVDHNNHDPKRARGVIVDARLHVEDNKTAALDPFYSSQDSDPSLLPPTWVELLLEVDAKAFPRLAKAIEEGSKDSSRGIDGFSMGANVGYTVCNICYNKAKEAHEFCSHIANGKTGTYNLIHPQTGQRISRKAGEFCHEVSFFEISAVFDPADETALLQELRTAAAKFPVKNAEVYPQAPQPGAEPSVSGEVMCPNCVGSGLGEMGECPNCRGEGYISTPVSGQDSPHLTPDHQHHPIPHGEFDPLPEGLHLPLNKMQGKVASEKVADNPLPQSMHEKSPADVDTLRDESVCDVCGSLMDGETCSVCGWVQEPDGLNNPDLSKAKEMKPLIQDQQDQDPTAQPAPTGKPVGQDAPGGQMQSPYAGGPPTNPTTTAGVTNRPMKWAISLHPKTAGKINKGERPILPGNPPVSNEPDETILKDYAKPTTSAMQTARSMLAAVERNNMKTADAEAQAPEAAKPDAHGDVQGVGGFIEDNNEAASKADAQVDVLGVGGTGVEGVAADEVQDVTQGTEKSKNIEAIPTKTWNGTEGQHDPVTNEVFEGAGQGKGKKSNEHVAYESGPGENLISDPEPPSSKGVQPSDPVGNADERVQLTEPVTSPENNSGPTKTWSGTDGNGVTKQRDPVTNETPWFDESGKSARVQLLAAMKLAETEVELGLLHPEKKFARIAELESESIDSIRASLKFANRVKQAGLQKRVAKVAKMPSFAQPVQIKEASINDVDDSAIFS